MPFPPNLTPTNSRSGHLAPVECKKTLAAAGSAPIPLEELTAFPQDLLTGCPFQRTPLPRSRSFGPRASPLSRDSK